LMQVARASTWGLTGRGRASLAAAAN